MSRFRAFALNEGSMVNLRGEFSINTLESAQSLKNIKKIPPIKVQFIRGKVKSHTVMLGLRGHLKERLIDIEFMNYNPAPKGYKYVFCRSVKRKDGCTIYPRKAKFFRFLVKA